ncbi:MAG: isochorismatase family protein [Mangrovibacterium sp.]
MRITRENTIGLVIDIQEKLVPVMEEQEDLLRNCKILIEGLQELGIPVVVTQQYTKGLGTTVEPIRSVIKDFNPIEKREFSCCDAEAVSDRLSRIKAQKVIICGIESHVCVLQTAVDLKEAGYIPVVVMDCVSSRSWNSVDLAAERFRHEGIMMTSCESILFELTRSSAAPEFKSISNLVK